MTKYGYARVSSSGQSLDDQVSKLRAAGCEIVRAEKISGKSTEGRAELRVLLDFMRTGDELWITRIDRVARSVIDLLKIVEELRSKGATLRATEQPIDASSPHGQAFLSMLGVFAQFERDLILERQKDGIARARVEGRFGGAPRRIGRDEVLRLIGENVPMREIARRLHIGVATVYRIFKEVTEQEKETAE
jgi:DNA invertase Pin-like site-specific DNA recombinase